MQTKSSESAYIRLKLITSCLLGLIAVSLALVSFASTPSSGGITVTNATDSPAPLTYTAGPFNASNATPVIELDSGPECGGLGAPGGKQAQPCDDYTLTTNISSTYLSAHPNASMKVTMSWTDAGAGQSDYDLYVYKQGRADCSPSDCTQTDGTEQADYQSASGNNPEVAIIGPLVQGTQKYTVVVVPYTGTRETINVKIELVPGPDGSGGGGGGGGGGVFGGADPATPGVPRFQIFEAPQGTTAQPYSGEFNIGFNPHTGRIMVMNSGPVWRIMPWEQAHAGQPECCEGIWEDVSPATTNFGLDPILWTDQLTGRSFVSNNTTGTSFVYAYSDIPNATQTWSNTGDGTTTTTNPTGWTQVGLSTPNGSVDHETLGTGPYPPPLTTTYPAGNPANQGHATYYCAQDIVGPAQCYRSDDLGASWGPSVAVYNGLGSGVTGGTDCGGLHGHVHVAPDGTVWLPVSQCAGFQGGVYSIDGGANWTEFKAPSAAAQTDGADPSIAIDHDSKIYYAYVKNQAGGNEGHARVAVGALQCATDSITGLRAAPCSINWINDTDIGASHGIINAAEIEAVGDSAGADDGINNKNLGVPGRAAVGFLGTDKPGDYQQIAFGGNWYPFIATTYDGGATWSTVNATPNDPVQHSTGIWQQGGSNLARNLLDFNEITIDSKGRVLYGYSDGCVSDGCRGLVDVNDYTAFMRVARQSGGKTLFAQYDPTEPAAPKPPCLSGTRNAAASHLTWKTPDNGGSEIQYYQIYRGTSSGAEQLIGATSGPKTQFEDTTADGTVATYYYTVKAINGQGTGIASNEIILTVVPAAAIPAPLDLCDGTDMVTDATGDARNEAPGNQGPTDQSDIKSISFSTDGGNLTSRLKIANLSGVIPPPNGFLQYFVIWTGPNGTQYATEADVSPGATTNDPPTVLYSYGAWDAANEQIASSSVANGTYTAGVDGTISVDVPLSAIGNPTVPLTDPAGNAAVNKAAAMVRGGEGTLGTGTIWVAPFDRAPNAGYSNKRFPVCAPNTAPIVDSVAASAPPAGSSNLAVTLVGTAHDPDATDYIARYSFDFGNGNIVEGDAGNIVHTFPGAGTYTVTLRATDSRSLQSSNLQQIQVTVPQTTTPPPVNLTVSRKTHGVAGNFDIPLPLSGTPGVECRREATQSNHTVVIAFTNPLAADLSGVTLSATARTLSGTQTLPTPTGGKSDTHEFTVNLTGVPNASHVLLTLHNIADTSGNSGDVIIPMDVLLGDTTGDGNVNGGDVGQTKSQSGIAVSAANFRQDVTADGNINGGDVGLVKSLSGTGLP